MSTRLYRLAAIVAAMVILFGGFTAAPVAAQGAPQIDERLTAFTVVWNDYFRGIVVQLNTSAPVEWNLRIVQPGGEITDRQVFGRTEEHFEYYGSAMPVMFELTDETGSLIARSRYIPGNCPRNELGIVFGPTWTLTSDEFDDLSLRADPPLWVGYDTWPWFITTWPEIVTYWQSYLVPDEGVGYVYFHRQPADGGLWTPVICSTFEWGKRPWRGYAPLIMR